MLTMLTTFGAWTWFAAGVILLLLELMIPGAYMLWLGLAAVAVGAISLGVVWTWQMQCIAFVVLAAAAFPIWRRWGRSGKKASDQPFLNRRADALVGRLFTLEKPIVDGVGTIRVDDTIWRVKGPDSPAGMRVRIERTDGPMLIVARAA